METPAAHCRTDKSDFKLSYRGTVSILVPLSRDAEDWLDENIILQNTTGFGRGVVIEHHSLLEYIKAIDASGLHISKHWPVSAAEELR